MSEIFLIFFHQGPVLAGAHREPWVSTTTATRQKRKSNIKLIAGLVFECENIIKGRKQLGGNTQAVILSAFKKHATSRNSHLFWRTGQEARLLHVQQLLDAQHDSFSAGLSKVLLFVTQGQAEAQVQLGASERTKAQSHFLSP